MRFFLLFLLFITPALSESQCRAKLGSAAAQLTFDDEVLRLLGRQPEFNKPFWDYIEGAVSEKRILQGRALLNKHKAFFDRLERETGVDRAIVTAIWGMETSFGANMGSKPILRSLFTLACNGHRQDFFTGEFHAAVKISKGYKGVFKGSWAGAFGHTQFMPSTYFRASRDGDGDGKADLINSTQDALMSTGNLLKLEGWQSGLSWGAEISLPHNFKLQEADGKLQKPYRQWGIQRADGGTISNPNTQAAIFIPAGSQGPIFAITPNFRAIMKYNNSESYALAVAHLADRLKGGNEFERDWPRNEILNHQERILVQKKLISQGFLQGEADGRMGSKTRDALRAWQVNKGLLPDGFATRGLLARL